MFLAVLVLYHINLAWWQDRWKGKQKSASFGENAIISTLAYFIAETTIEPIKKSQKIYCF